MLYVDPVCRYPILLISLFNVGDAVGRFILHINFIAKIQKEVAYIITLSRFSIILFFLLALSPLEIITYSFIHIPVIFLFGVSNGFTVAYYFHHLGDLVELEERGLAATFMCFSIQIGLFTGSVLGFFASTLL